MLKFLSRHTSVLFLSLITVPSAAPHGLAATAGLTFLVISWDQLALSDQNGIITHYTVYYRQAGIPLSSRVNITSSILSTNITGLDIHTNYIAVVSASTSAGEGPQSSEATFKTAEGSKST